MPHARCVTPSSLLVWILMQYMLWFLPIYFLLINKLRNEVGTFFGPIYYVSNPIYYIIMFNSPTSCIWVALSLWHRIVLRDIQYTFIHVDDGRISANTGTVPKKSRRSGGSVTLKCGGSKRSKLVSRFNLSSEIVEEKLKKNYLRWSPRRGSFRNFGISYVGIIQKQECMLL